VRYMALPAVICAALLLAGCEALAQKTGISILGLPKPVRLTPDESGKDVRLVHAQQMIVRLPRDPALADYEWGLREPQTVRVTAEGAPVAGPKEEVWTFTPVRSGQETLRLEYRRPRQPDARPAKTVSYNIAVP
jgi:predicted secreted protein